MSVLFFEGLPRAGKSYEAMVTQIIPALKRGREVVAYIEGLNFERIAECCALPVERVRELLHPLERDDMRPIELEERGRKVVMDGAWIRKTRDNALHVFDEAQNWWPNRHKASEALTQFVTEHGHRGIDILLMGQSMADVLALWRRRVEQKFAFEKLTAVGADNRYQVTIYKGRGGDSYTKVSSAINKYDKQYFGTYASHVSSDTNTANYVDPRVRVWNNPAIKYGLPAALALGVWGASSTWRFFHPEPDKPAPQLGVVQPGPAPVPVVAQVPAAPPAAPSPAASVPDNRSPQERYLADISAKSRIRLAGLMEARGKVTGVVEWLDGTTHVSERTTFEQLRALGVQIQVMHQAVHLQLGTWQALATQWPLEAEGMVSDNRQAIIAGRQAAAAGTQSDQVPRTVPMPDGPAWHDSGVITPAQITATVSQQLALRAGQAGAGN
ncbi:Zonular occludens toxin [Paracidovorax avenae]|uniref:zonular occludens toxin family protein n=1 Tax=Paracidovorax avenae TaxID=80867 RepID=UPI000D15EF72|nr:zonular occludens toxin domain-containing protein [Paracidovorax avenae]AVS62566.1 Zonular occludens toxin [Paracidovorax avenae]